MDLKTVFFSMDGRLNRKPFWLATLALIFINAAMNGVAQGIGGAVGNLIALVTGLGVLWPSICVTGKRWHDRNKSAWWMLIILIPVVGWIWAFVESGCMRGTVGPNLYGDDPLMQDLT